MPIKPEKRAFTREEILALLENNARLYRHEDGFVPFFVELAAYLFDLEHNALAEFESSGFAPAAPSPVRIEDEGPMLLPPTVAERKEQEINPGSGRFVAPSPFRGSIPPPPPAGAPAPELDEDLDQEPSSRRFVRLPLVTQSALQTPVPDSEKLPSSSSASIPRQGAGEQRTSGTRRVYHVVKPYRAPTTSEIPCKVCGTRVAAELEKCPNCGTPVG